MKVVILNLSPRNNGLTASLLHVVEEELKKYKEVHVDFCNIGDYIIAPCLGCYSCYKTGKCHIDDDGESLSVLIGGADIIIFGSPTYASNITGQGKILIDRGHFVLEQLLTNKYAICITTGENYGNKDSLKILKKLCLYSGAFISKAYPVTQPYGSRLSEKMIRKTKRAAHKIYKDAVMHKKYILQRVIQSIIFYIGIKPFVLKRGEQMKGVIKRWESMGLDSFAFQNPFI
ncbi:MAG: flavodoxin family protein [Defluviitaleaceae bacterium]|nr:flavodoxin family protein [Defluviitaleaceae bacterium]